MKRGLAEFVCRRTDRVTGIVAVQGRNTTTKGSFLNMTCDIIHRYILTMRNTGSDSPQLKRLSRFVF